jgi:hypothetical protein
MTLHDLIRYAATGRLKQLQKEGWGTQHVPEEFMDAEEEGDEEDDDDIHMEAGENNPLQKGSADPHGPKAARIRHDDYRNVEDFQQALYEEVNEFAGVDLYKTRFGLAGQAEWRHSAGELADFFKTTNDMFYIENFKEHKSRCHKELKKLHPDKRMLTFPNITPEKAEVIDRIVLVINLALELFERRCKDAWAGSVISTRKQVGRWDSCSIS